MSKLGISTGTTPNDGNGDSLLSGAVKINSNFDEIYTFFGDGTNLTGAGVTYITAGSGISVDQNTGNVTITATGGGGGGESYWAQTDVGIHTLSNVGVGTTNPTSSLTVSGDILVTGIATHQNSISVRPSVIGNEFVSISPYGRMILGSSIGTAAGIDIINNTTSSSAEIFTISTPNVGLYNKKIIVDYGGRLLLGGNLDSSLNNAFTVLDNSGNINLTGYVSVGGTIGASGATVTGTTVTDQLSVSGVSTFNDDVVIADDVILSFGTDDDLTIKHITLGGGSNYNFINGENHPLYIRSPEIQIQSGSSNYNAFTCNSAGTVMLHWAATNTSSVRLETLGAGVTITGTTFTDQLSVSGVSTFNGNITVAGIITASVGSSSGIVTYYGDTSNAVDGRWILTGDGSNYTFTGIGITSGNNTDPKIYLARARVYEFVNTQPSSHPFVIRDSDGGAEWTAGVSTSTDGTNDILRFEVPMNAPNTLYYQCTVHSGMGNTISVYPNTI